jgi:hypothetical protein
MSSIKNVAVVGVSGAGSQYDLETTANSDN